MFFGLTLAAYFKISMYFIASVGPYFLPANFWFFMIYNNLFNEVYIMFCNFRFWKKSSCDYRKLENISPGCNLDFKVTPEICSGLSSLGVPGVPGHTQILADQLTLFQPGGTDYAHVITTGTPGFSDLPTALMLAMKYLDTSLINIAHSNAESNHFIVF